MTPDHDLGLIPSPEFRRLEVGRPYDPARRRWPEGSHYNFQLGIQELLLLFSDLSAGEVAAVQFGRAHFGLHVAPPLVVLLYRFEGPAGSLGWGDAPYNYHMVRPAVRVPPVPLETLTPESRVPLLVHLVGAGDGLVRANRALSLAPPFTRALYEALHAQVAAPCTQAEYNRAVDALYKRFKNPDDFLTQPGLVRCLGGE